MLITIFIIILVFILTIGYLKRSKTDSKMHIIYNIEGKEYIRKVPLNKFSEWIQSQKEESVFNQDLSKIVDTVLEYQNNTNTPANFLFVERLGTNKYFTAMGPEKKDRHKMLAIENQLSDALKKNSRKKYVLNKNIGKLKDNISKDFNKKYGKKHIGHEDLDVSQKSKLLETDKYDGLSRKELSKKAKEVKELAKQELHTNKDDINYDNLQKLIKAQEFLAAEDEDKVYEIMDDAKKTLTIDDLIKNSPKNKVLKGHAKDLEGFESKYDNKTKELLDSETQKDIDPEKLKDAEYQDHLKAVYNLVKDDSTQKNKLQEKLTGAFSESILGSDKVKEMVYNRKESIKKRTKELNTFNMTKEEYDSFICDISHIFHNSLKNIDEDITSVFKDAINAAEDYGINIENIIKKFEAEAKKVDIVSRDRLFLVYQKLKDDPSVSGVHDIPELFKTVLKKIEETDRQYISKKINDIFKDIDEKLDSLSGSIPINSAIFIPLGLEETTDIMDHVVNKLLLDDFSRYMGNSQGTGDEVSVAAMKGWLKEDNNKEKLVNAVQSYVRSLCDKSINENKLGENILPKEKLTPETRRKIDEAVGVISNGVKSDPGKIDIVEIEKQIKQSQINPNNKGDTEPGLIQAAINGAKEKGSGELPKPDVINNFISNNLDAGSTEKDIKKAYLNFKKENHNRREGPGTFGVSARKYIDNLKKNKNN